MATDSVPNPAARHPCEFKLKKYQTVFTCYICMVESYDTERYRCDHCDRARHKGCFRLRDAIQLKDAPDGIFKGWGRFELKPTPQTEPDSKNKKWAAYCVVCGMHIKYYSYHYRHSKDKKDVNMHPCCAALIGHDDEVKPLPYDLQLRENNSCFWCGSNRPQGASKVGPTKFFCWSYQLRDGKNNRIHVHCYSEMVIQALRIVQSDDNIDDDGRIRIILKPRGNQDANKLVETAITTALELVLGDPIEILLSWLVE
ncbi:hypothetical protein CDL15_Pgr002268 [Punica granatum]|uniref:Phorbol-ester/DAG-type domain-containing protein n=1 Tax=Punica granatum TaxID=22663 RepID=A0A218WGW8_PUNGR|nr:hypothetical protein CDL15_Pgr002268 [Punica granatum]